MTTPRLVPGPGFVLSEARGFFPDWRPVFTPEEWRPAPGFPDYEVSDWGRVRSWRKRGPKPGRALAPRLLAVSGFTDSGYPVVTLAMPNGVRSARAVHRLVLRAFVGSCPDGMEACHNDGDRLNCALYNLRWDTHSGNALDTLRHGHVPAHDPESGRWLPGALTR